MTDWNLAAIGVAMIAVPLAVGGLGITVYSLYLLIDEAFRQSKKTVLAVVLLAGYVTLAVALIVAERYS